MLDQLITLFVGFVLTSVFGGVLGHYFQKRSWQHQHRARVLETEYQTAFKAMEDVSRLLDKRLYRMRLLYWRLTDEHTDQGKVDHYLGLYQEVLYEWNDNLNRNLALVQAYFGTEIRVELERRVYEQFRDIGIALEQAYLLRKREQVIGTLSGIAKQIEALSAVIYHLNLQMIDSIQRREIGLFSSARKN